MIQDNEFFYFFILPLLPLLWFCLKKAQILKILLALSSDLILISMLILALFHFNSKLMVSRTIPWLTVYKIPFMQNFCLSKTVVMDWLDVCMETQTYRFMSDNDKITNFQTIQKLYYSFLHMKYKWSKAKRCIYCNTNKQYKRTADSVLYKSSINR